jgi:hypothetical protein
MLSAAIAAGCDASAASVAVSVVLLVTFQPVRHDHVAQLLIAATGCDASAASVAVSRCAASPAHCHFTNRALPNKKTKIHAPLGQPRHNTHMPSVLLSVSRARNNTPVCMRSAARGL